MITQTTIEEYLKKIQSLQAKVILGEADLRDLQQTILAEAKQSSGDRSFEAFFRGESEFYKQDYQTALKSYLESTEVPFHHFFCFRASAFLYNELNQPEKAFEFAEKSLSLKPNDISTLDLLVNKLSQARDNVKWPQWKNRFETILQVHRQSAELAPAKTTEARKTAELPTFVEAPSPKFETPVAADDSYESARASTQQFFAESLGIDRDASQSLESRIKSFKEFQQSLVREYICTGKGKETHWTNGLYVLNGWSESTESSADSENEAGGGGSSSLLTEGVLPTTGGYYIRWNKKGIVINPGKNFLRYLHRQGLNIRDIDAVVVTRRDPECYHDLQAIYHLNYRINGSSASDLHVIRYYLHQAAHQQIGSHLKANFKQEKDSVHSLDFYLDSPELERVDLFEGATLYYFPTCSQEALSARNLEEEERRTAALGIRLDLTPVNDPTYQGTGPMRIGYVAGSGWSPFISNHLGTCDVLISGLESTCPTDYGKVKYNEETLGYFGSFSLLEEVAPRLMLCCEYNGQQGDVRLEIARKMRQEFAPTSDKATTILPGDCGLVFDLNRFKVICSVTQTPIDPENVRVAKTQDAFGRLLYLSPKTFI